MAGRDLSCQAEFEFFDLTPFGLEPVLISPTAEILHGKKVCFPCAIVDMGRNAHLQLTEGLEERSSLGTLSAALRYATDQAAPYSPRRPSSPPRAPLVCLRYTRDSPGAVLEARALRDEYRIPSERQSHIHTGSAH